MLVLYVLGLCKPCLKSLFYFSCVAMSFMHHVWVVVTTCRFRLILFYDISNLEVPQRGVSVEVSPCMFLFSYFIGRSDFFLNFFVVNRWSRRDWTKDVLFVTTTEKAVGYCSDHGRFLSLKMFNLVLIFKEWHLLQSLDSYHWKVYHQYSHLHNICPIFKLSIWGL